MSYDKLKSYSIIGDKLFLTVAPSNVSPTTYERYEFGKNEATLEDKLKLLSRCFAEGTIVPNKSCNNNLYYKLCYAVFSDIEHALDKNGKFLKRFNEMGYKDFPSDLNNVRDRIYNEQFENRAKYICFELFKNCKTRVMLSKITFTYDDFVESIKEQDKEVFHIYSDMENVRKQNCEKVVDETLDIMRKGLTHLGIEVPKEKAELYNLFAEISHEYDKEKGDYKSYSKYYDTIKENTKDFETAFCYENLNKSSRYFSNQYNEICKDREDITKKYQDIYKNLCEEESNYELEERE